jgi:phosphotransferase system HPr (HPr) family protein
LTKVVVAVEGWNAEAAIGFALAARKFASSVTLTSSREMVDGKDEIEVMTLGPGPCEEVMLTVDGKDEKQAFTTLLAKLLGVIAAPKDRLAAVTGPDTVVRKKSAKAPRRRVAEIAALDVEEVAPVRSHSKRMRRKRAHRKQERKSGRKPTTTRRKPRKRKK